MILPEGVTIHTVNRVYVGGDDCPDEVARAHGVLTGAKPAPQPPKQTETKQGSDD